jgi:hypothetical protein
MLTPPPVDHPNKQTFSNFKIFRRKKKIQFKKDYNY